MFTFMMIVEVLAIIICVIGMIIKEERAGYFFAFVGWLTALLNEILLHIK